VENKNVILFNRKITDLNAYAAGVFRRYAAGNRNYEVNLGGNKGNS
jgi:hypothetical protein